MANPLWRKIGGGWFGGRHDSFCKPLPPRLGCVCFLGSPRQLLVIDVADPLAIELPGATATQIGLLDVAVRQSDDVADV